MAGGQLDNRAAPTTKVFWAPSNSWFLRREGEGPVMTTLDEFSNIISG